MTVKTWTDKKKSTLAPQGPPTDAPAVDTAEQVYISSLALLKVTTPQLSFKTF